MRTEAVTLVVGDDADTGNRSLARLGSVPARNRLTPSSWVTEKVSVCVSVNVNRKTVACANPPKLKGLVRHAVEVQVAGVPPGVPVKKPGIVLIPVSL